MEPLQAPTPCSMTSRMSVACLELKTHRSPAAKLRRCLFRSSSLFRNCRIFLAFSRGAASEHSLQFEERFPSINNETAPVKDVAELTLDLLEWPRFLRVVSSFAGTSTAKELIQNFSLPSSRVESESLLSMTAASIDLLSHLGSSLDFGGIQSKLVESSLVRIKKGFIVTAEEATAIALLLKLTSTLRSDMKTYMDQAKVSDGALMVFLETIYTMGGQQEILKAISRTIDDDGNIKDGASAELQRARIQYRMLENKVQDLLRSVLKEKEDNGTVQVIDGRFCIAVSIENQRSFSGLLLRGSSGGATTSYVEPVALVSLNDQLGEARASIAKAEYEVLCALTKKLLPSVESLSSLLDVIIQLDVVVARGKFSVMYEGSFPTFSDMQIESNGVSKEERENSIRVNPGNRLFVQLSQTYHPLLLYQYKEQLRRLKIKPRSRQKESSMKPSAPVPIDINISLNTRVVTITGPNTGGKTAAMKTLGLSALMAKSGFYVLAKSPALLPWFDAIFADIGDEQSLTQSLSTFSGHLQRINQIKRSCTKESLVLLDEVGTGTNPIEGAALGMSILESFASDGAGSARLTLASTHHAELKTLKYSDSRFENASVEFNEETLKPTFKVLWGVPGRSNALNISERLGVPKSILAAAKGQLGVANAEINEVIMELEKLKRELENDMILAEQYLKKTRLLYASIQEAAESVQQEEENSATYALNILQDIAHKARADLSSVHHKKLSTVEKPQASMSPDTERASKNMVITSDSKLTERDCMPEIGTMVFVPKLGKQAKVVQVLAGKKVVVVQSGSLQLRMSLADIEI